MISADTVRNPRHPGRCELNYPPGLALLRFPVMGPLALIADRSQKADLVVSNSEEKASLWLGALAVVIEGFCVLLAMRRLGIAPAVANFAALAGCFGTGLFHYGTFDGSFTHAYSSALFAGLLLVGVTAGVRRRSPNPFLVFVLSLFISLVREPDIPVLLVALGAFLAWQVRPLPAPERLRAALRSGLPVLLAVAGVVCFQVLYNRWASGVWTLDSYGGEKFTPGAFNELRVLFSYNHGLFVWYPVLALLLIVAVWRRGSRSWGLLAVVVVAVLTVIYGSWPAWFLGGGFGLRGFVDVVPFITVAGAMGISAINVRWLRRVALGGVVVLSIASVELMAAYWEGTIPFSNNTPHQYWRVVVGQYSLLNGRLG